MKGNTRMKIDDKDVTRLKERKLVGTEGDRNGTIESANSIHRKEIICVDYTPLKDLLFDAVNNYLFIDDEVYPFKDAHHMYDYISKNMMNDYSNLHLPDEFDFEYRIATDDELERAMPFEKLIKNRIQEITIEDLQNIKQFEDYYLAAIYNMICLHKEEEDVDTLVKLFFLDFEDSIDFEDKAELDPNWIGYFETTESLIETVTMFVRKFKDQR